MVVEGDSDRITVESVAVGEVWIAGGQSNMDFPLRFEKHRGEELGNKSHNLRFFDVPKQFYPRQAQDFGYDQVGFWREANEENLPYFSAVGYYFQKELAAALSVPVGIIGCNWGSTRPKPMGNLFHLVNKYMNLCKESGAPATTTMCSDFFASVQPKHRSAKMLAAASCHFDTPTKIPV